jgi:hypothetical protein
MDIQPIKPFVNKYVEIAKPSKENVTMETQQTTMAARHFALYNKVFIALMIG